MATEPEEVTTPQDTVDDDALQRLLVQYYPRLRLRLLKDLQRDFRRYFDVEDIIQDAFIAAFRAPATARPSDPTGFYRWLERIALNDLIDAKRALLSRKRDIRRNMPPNSNSSVMDVVQCVAVFETPSGKLSRKEAVAAALSCLARLSGEQRQVIRARFLERQTVAEVAGQMDKTEAAIHSLCYRALQSLRKQFRSISHFLSPR